MTSVAERFQAIKKQIPEQVTLVAVSKTKPAEAILEAYNTGHRIFGENKVQELCSKYEVLPKDIEWHLIGHLQTNKVKYVVPFVKLIHGVDSLKLLAEIDKQSQKAGRITEILLQVYIATEETKFGLTPEELSEVLESLSKQPMDHVKVKGLMGMASNTENESLIKKEFDRLKEIFDRLRSTQLPKGVSMDILSMGMSSDFSIAIKSGSNMVRIGSLLFGERNYPAQNG